MTCSPFTPTSRWRLTRWRGTLLLPCLLLAAVLSGCGYSRSDSQSGYQWRSLYREDVQTVAVPIFTNATYDRGVEFDLTKAVINELEASTPYKVAPRERADTILEGQIVATGVSNLSNDPHAGIPQEQLVALRVSFVWKDLRTGRIYTDRREFDQTAALYPTLGEGRFVARQQAIERLAEAIVQELQEDW